MDALSIYCNAIWQDAQRPRRRVQRPNTAREIAAFTRRLGQASRLVYSATAGKWIASKTRA